MDGVSFEQLVAQVDQITASDDPLDRVDAGGTVAAALAGHADSLVDHLVAQARAAGRSWTEIGARLGVSKQAARKRFTDTTTPTSGLTPVLPPELSLRPRLRSCLTRADQLAQAAGAAQVGAEHLLAGLLTDGVAAAILDKLAVTADAITTSTLRLFGPANRPTDTVPPLSADAVCAIEAAAQHAQVRADNPDHVTVGTEHLLAVLAHAPGARAATDGHRPSPARSAAPPNRPTDHWHTALASRSAPSAPNAPPRASPYAPRPDRSGRPQW